MLVGHHRAAAARRKAFLEVFDPVDQLLLPGQGQRRRLVVATGLQPGETLQFRVCAERVERPGKDLIHARVCAKLSARRLG